MCKNGRYSEMGLGIGQINALHSHHQAFNPQMQIKITCVYVGEDHEYLIFF